MYRTKYKQVHYVHCSFTTSRLRVEDISKTAVDAGDRFTIVQVDVDSRVAESSTTSVTGDLKVIMVSSRQTDSKTRPTTRLLTAMGGTSFIKSMAHWLLTCFSRPVTANLALRGSDSENCCPVWVIWSFSVLAAFRQGVVARLLWLI